MKEAYMNWSGGKDCALALYKVKMNQSYEVKSLFTTINKETNQIPMHHISRELVRQQAIELHIPLLFFELDVQAKQPDYATSVRNFIESNIKTSLFGDIHIDWIRQRREAALRPHGMSADFPLWGMTPSDVVKEFVALGFKAVITSVDGNVLAKEYLGTVIDEQFIQQFPKEADLAGENGEYHSFVFDGPLFEKAIAYEVGCIHRQDYIDEAGKKSTFYHLNLQFLENT